MAECPQRRGCPLGPVALVDTKPRIVGATATAVLRSGHVSLVNHMSTLEYQCGHGTLDLVPKTRLRERRTVMRSTANANWNRLPASAALQLRSQAGRYAFPWARYEMAAAQGARQRAAQSRSGSLSDSQRGSLADSPASKLARLEAVLFLTREPISTRKLANLARLADGTEARTLLKTLSRRYDQRGSAIQIVEVAGGVQMFTRPVVSDWIRRMHGESEEIRLSAPALETLAVVAYRQPVVRAEVEAIRGVQCGEILRVLMERDLLRIVGRSEELGRPFLYGTSKRFLQVFGLRRLEELPPVDQIQGSRAG
jgi:segregation and condensation protein B